MQQHGQIAFIYATKLNSMVKITFIKNQGKKYGQNQGKKYGQNYFQLCNRVK